MYIKKLDELHKIMLGFSKIDDIDVFIERPIYNKIYYEDPVEEGSVTIDECKYVLKDFSDVSLEYDVNGYIAVTSSSYRIGETNKGNIMLLRGSIVLENKLKEIYILGPYVIHITKKTSIDILNKFREQLMLQHISSSRDFSINQLMSMIREYFENMLKLYVLSNFSKYIVFINRSLTTDSKDFLNPILDHIFKSNNFLVGFSKYSTIRLQDGRPIYNLIKLNKAGYIELYNCIKRSLKSKLYGKTYLAKFTPNGETYRVDICSMKYPSEDILNLIYKNIDFWIGYPNILAIANMNSVFRKRDLVAIKAYILSQTV